MAFKHDKMLRAIIASKHSTSQVPNGTCVVKFDDDDFFGSTMTTEWARNFKGCETVYDSFIVALDKVKRVEVPEDLVIFLTHLPNIEGLNYILSKGIRELHYIFGPEELPDIMKEFKYEQHKDYEDVYYSEVYCPSLKGEG